MQNLVYLACPYSDPDFNTRIKRFEAVNRAAAKFIKDGIYVFSPISHTHPIAVEGDLKLGWDFWQDFDKFFLSKCNKLIVLKLEGWEKGVGVQAEIKYAKELGIPVEYMEEI